LLDTRCLEFGLEDELWGFVMGQLTEIHDVVSADRTIVNNDVPCPKSNSIPLD
jgi:hypothetical protein